jgi:hypothetical protein
LVYSYQSPTATGIHGRNAALGGHPEKRMIEPRVPSRRHRLEESTGSLLRTRNCWVAIEPTIRMPVSQAHQQCSQLPAAATTPRYSNRRQSKRRRAGPLQRITLQTRSRVKLTSSVGPQTSPRRRTCRHLRFKPFCCWNGGPPHMSTFFTRVGLSTLSAPPLACRL